MFYFLLTMAVAAQAAVPANDQVTVFTRFIKEDKLSEELTYPARVVPRTNATVLSETDGIVTKILAPLGTRVKRRQPLVVIKHTDPVYEYAPVVLRASVDGIVSQVNVTPGSQVNHGDALMSVMDPVKPKIMIELTSTDLAKLSVGSKSDFLPNGNPGKVVLQIRGISPYVDPATGTASCELEPEPKQELSNLSLIVPGTLGQVVFHARERIGILVPESAVRYRGKEQKEPFLRVLQDGKVKYVAVELGQKQRGSVEVTKGLTPGMQIIERSSRYVAEGDVVIVQKDENSGA